jgi:lysophospholipase L1-like esterase
VVIALGANDGLRGLPLAQMRDNLNAMIDAARAIGAKVLLAGMRLPPNYGPYADGFHDSFVDIAKAKKGAADRFPARTSRRSAAAFPGRQPAPDWPRRSR